MKKLRLAVQLLFTAVTNGYMYGFLNGKIYRGGLKYACVPGLNCYSCPGAIAACPIGALQALLNQRGFQIPFAALGVLFLFGSLLGRFVCGWLCPFGLAQDLLHKIPVFKKVKRLPALPLPGANEALRGQAGGLFLWKLGILLGIVLLSLKAYRPFCQYLCPLGAVYGWFNRISLVQIHWEEGSCISCMACERACPLALSRQEISRSAECIRCGACVDACPQGCLHVRGKKAGPAKD